MDGGYPAVSVRVWGDLACFTRPEMKVERVTYPVPTPTAARGILEAIYWKPQFTWQVTSIWVLRPIRYFTILRNEVNRRASVQAARAWAATGGGYATPDDRAQRNTVALREVEYIIQAHVRRKPGVADDEAKFRDQFRRRVREGRCWATPYLGCREFSAHFAEPDGTERPINLTEDLGLMLGDVVYAPGGRGAGTPRFFPARLVNGILRVPEEVM
jgi:CRISPR-associated protein Cas5d